MKQLSVTGHAHQSNSTISAGMPDANSDLQRLRQLILESHIERQDQIEQLLLALQAQLDDRNQQIRQCANVLPAAIEHLHEHNVSLERALDPDVKQIVHRIFKNEPEAMAESLYPVLGPAIRRMIASLFEFSSSGKADTYSVEQLMLISRQDSLVIAKAVAGDVEAQDADVVSGMLEAIRSFIEDAFEVADYDGVDTLTLGDINVWTIWSPFAVLAVVVRGIPPARLKTYYENYLRELHLSLQLNDEKYLEGSCEDSMLDINLANAMVEEELLTQASSARQFISPGLLIGLILLSMIAIANVVSDNRQWEKSVRLLAAEPGVVILSREQRLGDDSMVLLHDPRARSRDDILESAGVDRQEVDVKWSGFRSADFDWLVKTPDTAP